jgi:hypothetical protein
LLKLGETYYKIFKHPTLIGLTVHILIKFSHFNRIYYVFNRDVYYIYNGKLNKIEKYTGSNYSSYNFTYPENINWGKEDNYKLFTGFKDFMKEYTKKKKEFIIKDIIE